MRDEEWWEAEELELSEWVSTLLRVLSPRRVLTIGLKGKNTIFHNFAQRKKMKCLLKITETFNIL